MVLLAFAESAKNVVECLHIREHDVWHHHHHQHHHHPSHHNLSPHPNLAHHHHHRLELQKKAALCLLITIFITSLILILILIILIKSPSPADPAIHQRSYKGPHPHSPRHHHPQTCRSCPVTELLFLVGVVEPLLFTLPPPPPSRVSPLCICVFAYLLFVYFAFLYLLSILQDHL